jgi:UDP-N-acetylmuramoyl-L-alanyl-D-glutamate--2,6-diaminopimelate ligase
MHTNKTSLPKIWPVTCHTDHVGDGTTFVAIKGFKQDGSHFIAQAIAQGARHIVVQEDVQLDASLVAQLAAAQIPITYVPDTRQALAELSAQAHGHPANKLFMIGITGTKGKTTTAYLTFAMLRAAGIKAALISTVENHIADERYPSCLTTPQPDYLHMFLARCVQEGVTHVVMEVAAQAIVMQRLNDIWFDAAAWTNFDHEHMEFFGTMEAYFTAKNDIRLFLRDDIPLIINNDDPELRDLPSTKLFPLKRYTLPPDACKQIYPSLEVELDGTLFKAPHLMGTFNAYNILIARALAHAADVDDVTIAQALATFNGIAGRLQRHALPNGAICYIDYAHTPASYMQVLELLRTLTDHLIVVFGCAGGKDRLKRPKMGAIAAEFADQVILTADNPAYECIAAICAEIMAGVAGEHTARCVIEPDRAEAIARAYRLSRAGSIIVVLGKGPDAYQVIGNVRLPYSDTAVVCALGN